MLDAIALAINLLDSAAAWRRDAKLYKGSRRQWRLDKAQALEDRALILEKGVLTGALL